MNIQGKPQWDFCCEWYGLPEIEEGVMRAIDTRADPSRRMPTDVGTQEFARWMAHQYRLAMNKGIEIAERESRELSARICDRMAYLEQPSTRAMDRDEMSRADAFTEAARQIRTGEVP